MQVNRVQSNNTSFGAKIKVHNLFREIKVSDELIEKAKKIGLENDVIEFSFGPIIKKSEYYHSPQDNFYLENWRTETRNKLRTTFTQEGKVKEKFSQTIYESDENILEDNKNVIEDTLDYLHTKYPNDIWA